MIIKSDKELEAMKKASEAVAVTLKEMCDYAKVGMSTKEIDDFGRKILSDFGAISAPEAEYGFPGCTCISVNHEAAHGIPSAKRILKEGDLVNIDVSAHLNGYFGDNGYSFILGEDKKKLSPLVEASKEILRLAISQVKSGLKISKLGSLIEKEAKKRGFTTIKNLVGHGIGKKLHESPNEIPNFKDPFNHKRFKKNSVIALETFISTKARYVYQQKDGWTMLANDGSYVTQHEHTLVITDTSPIILTSSNGI